MPPKTVTKTSAKSNDKLELSIAISKLALGQESFIKAVENLDSYKETALRELDLTINSKKEELQNLEDDLQKTLKDNQIEIDQFYREHQYEGALTKLNEVGEESIKTTELTKLQATISNLEKDQTDNITKAVNEAKSNGERAMSGALSNMKMAHKAETAELNAKVKQQELQSDNLTTTIENLKFELSEQRKLTQSVAEAARSAPITVNSGK
jgi:hypothetical protein